MQQGRQISPELGIRKAHKKDPEEASEMVQEREVPVCVPVNPHVQKGGNLAKRCVSVDLTALTPAQFCLLLNNCLLMKTEEVEWIIVKSVGRKGLLGSKGIYQSACLACTQLWVPHQHMPQKQQQKFHWNQKTQIEQALRQEVGTWASNTPLLLFLPL